MVFRKSFELEIADALTYPTNRVMCEAIIEYSAYTGEKLVFVSRISPISFWLGEDLYEAEIGMTRGGYKVWCREKKEI